MKRAWVRSTIFNLLFYGWNIVLCFAGLPFLLLPRPAFLGFVRFYLRGVHALEILILGLRYEVRGMENIPADGSYIIAAKHMSPYETLKLHLLFDDPAVILKKELLAIPLWGWYLKKADVIAIDRSSPAAASESIKAGALRMKAQGRPIVIFPQGTRVGPDQTPADKPYKPGVARIQEATGLPVVPLAMNSGMFWPRSGWGKSPGVVVFEFLKPLKTAKDHRTLVGGLEKALEKSSNALMEEARQNQVTGFPWLQMTVIAVMFFGLYTALWLWSADLLLKYYTGALHGEYNIDRVSESAAVTGYPFAMVLRAPRELITLPQGQLEMEHVVIKAWPLPLPFTPVDIHAFTLKVQQKHWKKPLVFTRARARMSAYPGMLRVHSAIFENNQSRVRLYGAVDAEMIDGLPGIEGTLVLEQPQEFLGTLTQAGIIDTRNAMFGMTAMLPFMKEGAAELPLMRRGQALYLGMFPVYKMQPTRTPGLMQRRNLSVKPL